MHELARTSGIARLILFDANSMGVAKSGVTSAQLNRLELDSLT